MRFRFLALIAIAACIATPALAHGHHHRHHHFAAHRRANNPAPDWGNAWLQPWQPWQQPVEASNVAVGIGHGIARMLGSMGGRPAAWCGWEMRRLVGADPGPAYNLARNWAHWGRPGAAGVGAVVVWPNHVGRIVGGSPGHWKLESGNDGHALRTRERPIGGAIAIRWG